MREIGDFSSWKEVILEGGMTGAAGVLAAFDFFSFAEVLNSLAFFYDIFERSGDPGRTVPTFRRDLAGKTIDGVAGRVRAGVV